MNAERTNIGHLANGQIAAYLDGRLPAAERAAVESHLAECDECRREVVEIARVARALPRRFRWAVIGPAAAAAAAVVLLVLARSPEREPAGGPVVRAGGEHVLSVLAVAPAEEQSVRRDSVTFAWRPAGPDISYRLTVTDERGTVLWSAGSGDTVRVLPRSVVLAAGRTYFWYVDALLPDGRSATSGVRRFRTAP